MVRGTRFLLRANVNTQRMLDVADSSPADFRFILDSIPGLVNTSTASGETEFVNRQILEYFGKSLEELKEMALQ
jgi:PAS domain-containing protein